MPCLRMIGKICSGYDFEPKNDLIFNYHYYAFYLKKELKICIGVDDGNQKGGSSLQRRRRGIFLPYFDIKSSNGVRFIRGNLIVMMGKNKKK